ncbi:MAG: tRNA (adenosine(37)-N6)-threonylcarbamoyltransferase complex dimerization subunit type 1 TsaB [Bulleidia sp.]|nr:tRNA (adenosine(37)-N6)-threonylcarbamoyltransferase complex dimerization subunit type 1 TsaB [Bulleidia sp.]
MITLCMDTSHTWLVIGLIKDDQVIGKVQEKCWKKQSEELFPRLTALMNDCHLQPEDIDQIVISKGPGSYTGVRIAMTVAKVFCAMADKPIYTVSTLLLYAGKKNCRVVTDARGKRVYTCLFFDGKALEEERAVEIENLEIGDVNIVGDGALVGRQDEWPDIVDNFLELKDEWEKHDNVHLVVPEYLKSSASYLPQKKA